MFHWRFNNCKFTKDEETFAAPRWLSRTQSIFSRSASYVMDKGIYRTMCQMVTVQVSHLWNSCHPLYRPEPTAYFMCYVVPTIQFYIYFMVIFGSLLPNKIPFPDSYHLCYFCWLPLKPSPPTWWANSLPSFPNSQVATWVHFLYQKRELPVTSRKAVRICPSAAEFSVTGSRPHRHREAPPLLSRR